LLAHQFGSWEWAVQRSDLIGAGILLAYYIFVVALPPVLLKLWTRTPREVVRKLHHIAYSLSIYPLLTLFSSWYMAIAAASLLIVIGYPALLILERTSWYQRSFIQRQGQKGELRRQLLWVQGSFALLIMLFWGVLGLRWQYIVAVSVTAWGLGDAAAALVGKAFGRPIVLPRLLKEPKTYEGTAAMAVVSAIALFLTLALYAQQPWQISLVISLVVAPVSALVELFSRWGLDTLTVPLSTALAILPLTLLFRVIGW
jgi:phytol kinase